MNTHHKVRCRSNVCSQPEKEIRVSPRCSSWSKTKASRPRVSRLATLAFVWLALPIPHSLQVYNPQYSSSTPTPPSSERDDLRQHHHQQLQIQQKAVKEMEIGQNITRILNSFFDSGYDKRIRPNYAGPPVEVGVTMRIVSISSINAVQMDFTSDFYFRQSWRDPRLSFTPMPGIQALYVGAEVIERIWVPDTFFANEKAAQFHTATTPNTFIRIKSNGEVFRSMRLTVTSSCPMNLQYFPMDRQSCTIEIESYGYSMADIQYKWGIDNKGSVNLAENLELPQFKVNKHRQMQKIETITTGNYSRLVCEIEFVRSMGYYLIQIYIPASLIVIISWVSFWLHRNASPARVQLGVTTVLTMTTLMSSTNAAMPKISYIKSIDVFLGTCFVMVFAALLEYATVGYMGKRIAMRKSRTQQIMRMLNEHREKCVAAAAASSAAAAAANAAHEAKDLDFDDDSPDRSGGISRATQLAHLMSRTSSMYPCNERAAFDNELHKREQFRFRSSSSTMENYNLSYTPHSLHAAGLHRATEGAGSRSHRSLERAASIKSRTMLESGDEENEISVAHAAGATQFNDDLSVFVPAPRDYGSTRLRDSGSNGGQGYNQEARNSELFLQSEMMLARQPQDTGSTRGRSDRAGGGSGSAGGLMSSQYYLLKSQNTLFGVCPSDIDKYSRVVFPVCFLCFNLMYWIIYMHISEFLVDDQGASLDQAGVTEVTST